MILSTIELNGDVLINRKVSLVGNVLFNNKLLISGDVKVGSLKGGIYPYYEGEYVVIPKSYEQMLDTDYKVMQDDVTVEKIPYSSVENIQGGLTITIGG